MSESIREEVPHPLTTDGWMPAAEHDEHSTVKTQHIADVTRAVNAIHTLSRLLCNSLGEPDSTGAQPLGRGVEITLADAIICLSAYAYGQTEDMGITAGKFYKYQREQGGDHG